MSQSDNPASIADSDLPPWIARLEFNSEDEGIAHILGIEGDVREKHFEQWDATAALVAQFGYGAVRRLAQEPPKNERTINNWKAAARIPHSLRVPQYNSTVYYRACRDEYGMQALVHLVVCARPESDFWRWVGKGKEDGVWRGEAVIHHPDVASATLIPHDGDGLPEPGRYKARLEMLDGDPHAG